MKKYDIALFDLDGTLSESGEGIIDTVREVFRIMNKPLPDEKSLSAFVGPPLYDSLRRCGFSDSEALRGFEIYKENFPKIGIYKNRLYDGIPELLSALKDNGVLLGVATTKYQLFADKIITMLGADRLFDITVGAEPDGERRTKAAVISYALERLGAVPGGKIVMIGDTKFDAAGASQTDCDFIGVLYGYGTRDEMEQAYKGKPVFVSSPSEIKELII